MQKNISFALVLAGLGSVLMSCNIYKPFASSTGEQAYLDLGQKCLHDGNYDCAIENFEKLETVAVKKKKLCSAYLGRAGVTLNVLLNVVSQGDSQMVGALANALVPYTAQKLADAVAAKTVCAEYGALAGTGDTGVMLATLGHMVDCGTRVSKTDKYLGADKNDTTCTTAGNLSGTITKVDINGAGPNNVMCSADVDACQQDFLDVNVAAVGGASLSGIEDALNNLPAAITGGATVDVRRQGIEDAIP